MKGLACRVFTAGDGGGSRSIHVSYMLMCVVGEPSVSQWDRDGNSNSNSNSNSIYC